MELRNTITVLAFRTTVRFAGTIAARALGDAGERVEGVFDRQATKGRVDIAEVLEPLNAATRAS